jgi:hypothetical protein
MPTITCNNCQCKFVPRSIDLEFYKLMDVPLPTWCPRCRHLRRHGHINDYVFFARSCDSCKKKIIAIFPPQSDYSVFCQSCWYAEQRDDKQEGRDFDFTRPFFEQFDELMHDAPQLGLIGMNNTNSDYCESVANCKNVYLISESSNCEDSAYCYWIQKTNSSLDCAYLSECEECYEVIDSFNCYNLRYSRDCVGCRDSVFLANCHGCSDCAFSVNLRHKQYYFFNVALSKEEYQRKLAEFELSVYRSVEILNKEFESFLSKHPHKHVQVYNSQNCIGDYIKNAKNCHQVFHCYDAEDCAYGEHVWRGAKSCMDSNTAGRNAELLYETTNSGINSYNVKFCRYCWGCSYTEYSNQCHNCRYLFGCVSLKPQSSYCILNKQYSPEDFEKLVQRIKMHMRETGEYGEFFPLNLSLFGYNTAVSGNDFPMTRNEVLDKGWKWEDQQSGTYGLENASIDITSSAPINYEDMNSDDVFACRECSKNYRFISFELNFYKRHALPLPAICPNCRQQKRLRKRNSLDLRYAKCTKCARDIMTGLALDKYPMVYCETCYESVLD